MGDLAKNEPAVCSCSKKGGEHAGCTNRSMARQLREKNYCPLLSSPADDICSAVPGLGPFNVRNLLTNWTQCSGEPTKCLVAGGPALGREAGGTGLAQPEEQEVPGGPNGSLLRCSCLRYTADKGETTSIKCQRRVSNGIYIKKRSQGGV